MLAPPVGGILSSFVVLYIHFHTKSGMKALSTNIAATFYCSGGTPPSYSAEPACPWHPVSFGQIAPSTAIALYSNSDLRSLGSMQYSNQNCIAIKLRGLN